jgi:hypothetical protein
MHTAVLRAFDIFKVAISWYVRSALHCLRLTLQGPKCLGKRNLVPSSQTALTVKIGPPSPHIYYTLSVSATNVYFQ